MTQIKHNTCLDTELHARKFIRIAYSKHMKMMLTIHRMLCEASMLCVRNLGLCLFCIVYCIAKHEPKSLNTKSLQPSFCRQHRVVERCYIVNIGLPSTYRLLHAQLFHIVRFKCTKKNAKPDQIKPAHLLYIHIILYVCCLCLCYFLCSTNVRRRKKTVSNKKNQKKPSCLAFREHRTAMRVNDVCRRTV